VFLEDIAKRIGKATELRTIDFGHRVKRQGISNAGLRSTDFRNRSLESLHVQVRAIDRSDSLE